MTASDKKIQKDILVLIAQKSMRASDIAQLLGYRTDAGVKSCLRGLKEKGLIKCTYQTGANSEALWKMA